MKETLVTKEKVLEASKSFLKETEDALEALLGSHETQVTTQVGEVASLLFAAKRLVHAYRTYPAFDPNCLSMMREDKALGLFVPTLAFEEIYIESSRLGVHGDSWSPKVQSRLFYDGPPCAISILLPENLIDRNRQVLMGVTAKPVECGFTLSPSRKIPRARDVESSGKVRRDVTIDRNILKAEPPPIPAGVEGRIRAASGEFDCMKLVWEAEWKGDPVKDPLVIGILRGKCFLVDQYDATKYERYIVSEMCQQKRD